MTLVDPRTAYRMWAPAYDRDPNPILELEARVLRPMLDLRPGGRVLDLATGTGRWLQHAVSCGADAYGLDVSPEMLAHAASKKLAPRLLQADLRALPFPQNFAGLAICSFALSYLENPHDAIQEMARCARRVIVSDLHPDAVRAGWNRSFRSGSAVYEIASRCHARSVLERCASAARLRPSWHLEASFGEPERPIFEGAGKASEFEAAARIPAVLITCWEHA